MVSTSTLNVYTTGEPAVSSSGTATISISATEVERLTVSDLWTDWTLVGQEIRGGTISDDIAGSGTAAIQYDAVRGPGN